MTRIPIVLAALLAFAIALPLAAQDRPASPAAAIEAQDDGLARTMPAPSATPAAAAATPAVPTHPVVVGNDKISSGDT
ncbi:MAG TPA: ammonia channel protein, partial [Casimicrobiaceae bacterium]